MVIFVYENSIKLLNIKSKMSKLKGNLIKRILWRLSYKKVAFTPEQRVIDGGRCVKCDAGPQLNKKSCSDYGCTCTMEQQFKRK